MFGVTLNISALSNSIRRNMRNNKAFTLIELLVVIAIVAVLITMVGALLTGCKNSTGSGSQVGQVVHFHKSGLAFQTWEGELAQGNNASQRTWHFSVEKADVASQVAEALRQGHTVRLDYDKNLVPQPWSGATPFRVHTVNVVTNR